jgi:F-type H+-transporting ATPase subunit b
LKAFRFRFFILIFLLCLGAASGWNAWALQAGSATPTGGGVSDPPNSGSASGNSPSSQQHPANEESGDDIYRHSPSVRLIGRWLHLGDEAAARLFEYLNFAILAGAVLFALWKYLPKTFRANREEIQHRLADARTATSQAHERLTAIEQRLSRLDEEIAGISKQAEKDSVEDEARIKASIEEERKRIVEAVGQEIAAAASSAQRELKQFAAELAVDRAIQKITLTEDDDRALVQEFAQSLGQQDHSGVKN